MTTQTEKLGEKIDLIVEQLLNGAYQCDYHSHKDFQWRKQFREVPVKVILKSSKEAGLKFVDYSPYRNPLITEIEV